MRFFTAIAASSLVVCCIEAADNLNVVDLAKPSSGAGQEEKSELVEGAVLAEDDGYWERFLQGQGSMEEKECDVEVTLTCEEASSGDSCDDILDPNDVCTASPSAIRFRFTCENCRRSGNSQDPAVAECTDSNGGPNGATGPFDVVVADGIDGSTITTTSVSCDDPILVDAARGSTLPDIVTVTVSDSQQNEVQTVTIDTSCDDEPFMLGDEFGAVEVTSFTNPVQGVSDCIFNIIYTYEVENNGDTDESINSLTTTINGVETDLTSRLDTLDLAPGDSVATSEAVLIDLCEEDEFEASTTVDASPQNEPEKTCDDTDRIRFEPPKACDVEVTLTCEVTMTDDSGNDSTVSCDDVPPPGEVEDCEKIVTYTYTVDNIGPTTETINTLSVTQGGVTDDCTDDLPTTTLQPGDNVSVEKTLLVNFCAEGPNREVVASATVNASPPSPGKTCEDTDVLVFTPPGRGDGCEVDVQIKCTPVGDVVDDCAGIPPTFTQCLQRPTEMQMRYNGGSCIQSFNLQLPGKFDCKDFGNGPPVTAHSADIRVVALKDANVVYFDGTVPINTEFTLFDRLTPGANVEADMLVTVVVDGNKVQEVNFHSSCSQNLFLKDKFGSVQFVGFINEIQGTISCFVNATFSFVIENTGSLTNAELQSLTVIRNGERFDFTERVKGAFIETGGRPVTIVQPILIDITVRRTYTTSIVLTGINPVNGVTCEDREDLIFDAGNPVPVGFPAVPTPTTSPTRA